MILHCLASVIDQEYSRRQLISKLIQSEICCWSHTLEAETNFSTVDEYMKLVSRFGAAYIDGWATALEAKLFE